MIVDAATVVVVVVVVVSGTLVGVAVTRRKYSGMDRGGIAVVVVVVG